MSQKKAKQTPKTQVDPKGLAKLYLRTDEVIPFFTQFSTYCDIARQKIKRSYGMFLIPYTLIALSFFMVILDEIGFDEDDEGAIIIIYSIVAVIVFFIVLGMYFSSLSDNEILKNKAKLFLAFFNSIKDDMHPESGMKGHFDHRKHQKEHIYKTKTSPYSGATKNYFKYPWAQFKFTLIDGSMVRIKCVDKLKEKSNSIVRFISYEKGELYFNPLVYKYKQKQISFRKNLAQNENEIKDKSDILGCTMATAIKQELRHLINQKGNPKSLSSIKKMIPKIKALETETNVKQELLSSDSPFNRCIDLLVQTKVPHVIIDEIFATHAKILYKKPNENEALIILIELHNTDQDHFIRLSSSLANSKESSESLLKANPAMAHARFAKSDDQLKLVKTLYLKTLDLEELDSAISGLLELGNQLQKLNKLPEKSKAYKFKRIPQWENLLLESALEKTEHNLISKEKKFKVTFPLKNGRKQSVQVRFDRQDLEGQQMISLLSFCGKSNPDLMDTCLEENMNLTYGAIGLAKLGEQDLFVVSENQLAQTADPKELQIALLQVAQKADDLESLLSTNDHY